MTFAADVGVLEIEGFEGGQAREDSELDLDPKLSVEIRSWIDCDMLIHGEVHNDRLRVALLRS